DGLGALLGEDVDDPRDVALVVRHPDRIAGVTRSGDQRPRQRGEQDRTQYTSVRHRGGRFAGFVPPGHDCASEARRLPCFLACSRSGLTGYLDERAGPGRRTGGAHLPSASCSPTAQSSRAASTLCAPDGFSALRAASASSELAVAATTSARPRRTASS